MKTIGYVLLAALLVAAVPCSAGAASVRIQPHQFKPADPSSLYNYQEPAHIWGDGGAAAYYAVVNLPVGRTITRLTFHHRSATPGVWSILTLLRTKLGQLPQVVAEVSGSLDTDDDVVPRSTTLIERPLVKADYTYYVRLAVGNGNYVHGVNVNYE